jgi:hypothetical protein
VSAPSPVDAAGSGRSNGVNGPPFPLTSSASYCCPPVSEPHATSWPRYTCDGTVTACSGTLNLTSAPPHRCARRRHQRGRDPRGRRSAVRRHYRRPCRGYHRRATRAPADATGRRSGPSRHRRRGRDQRPTARPGHRLQAGVTFRAVRPQHVRYYTGRRRRAAPAAPRTSWPGMCRSDPLTWSRLHKDVTHARVPVQ